MGVPYTGQSLGILALQFIQHRLKGTRGTPPAKLKAELVELQNWGWHCGLSGFPNLARLGGKISWPMMLACTSCSEGEYWWQQEVRACQASIMGRPEMPLALALAAGRPSPS